MLRFNDVKLRTRALQGGEPGLDRSLARFQSCRDKLIQLVVAECVAVAGGNPIAKAGDNSRRPANDGNIGNIPGTLEKPEKR